MRTVEILPNGKKKLVFPRNEMEVFEYEQGRELGQKENLRQPDTDRMVADVLSELRAASQGDSVDQTITRRDGSTLRIRKSPQRLGDHWQGIGNNIYGVIAVTSPIWIIALLMFWQVGRQL